MTDKELRKKVGQFQRQFDMREVTYPALCTAMGKLGYTVVEFNHIFNDPDVQALIDSLHLSDDLLRSRGFTYADRNYRLVFIHEDLSQEEKVMVATHEAGHIWLDHISAYPIIGRDVREEYEANSFSRFLLKPPVCTRLALYAASHKKGLRWLGIGTAVLAVALVIGGFIYREQQYYGEYYITTTGNHYHEAECIFVKDKTSVRRLTITEFESGEYDRCHICLP